MLRRLLVKPWKLLRGRLQWYILWWAHSKFVIGVAGVLFDDSGRILLLRHRFWAEGSWGLPGGYVKRGERLEDSLAREVREETGLSIRVDSVLRIVSGYRLRVEILFRGTITGGQLVLDSGEVIDAKFFEGEGVAEGLLPSHHEHIQFALRNE